MLGKTNIAERRYKAYDLISYALINEPTKELIRALKDLGRLFDGVGEESIELLKEDNLDEYKQEFYDRFFINTSPLYIPPFESAIKNKSVGKDGKVKYGKLDSKETFHVKSCYMMVDFDPNQLNMFEPLRNNYFQDNIGYEFSFMAFLTNRELVSMKNADEEIGDKWRNLQKDFLKDHLLTWIKDYAKLTSENGKGLYSFVADIASLWIELDYEFLLEE